MVGLEFHLAWSLFQYFIVLILTSAMLVGFFTSYGRKVRWHMKVLGTGLAVLAIHFAAFDVGQRQSDLQRSNFNTPQVGEVDTASKENLTPESAKRIFDSAVESMHERNKED